MDIEITGPAGQMHVDDGGSGGLPVVFVHSFGGSSGHWAEQLEHLRRGRRAVAFDLRGHGRSESPNDDAYAIADLAADLAAVIDGLGLERAVLVGHSIGGLAAIAYAGDHPARVAGLLLVGTPGRVPADQADRIMAAMRSDYDATMASYWDRLLADATPKVKAQVKGEMGRMSQAVAMRLIGATFAHDPLPALRAYRGPTMTLTVGESPYDLHAQLPDLPDVHMSGTSHWAQMDRPAEFDRVMDAFLERVESADAVPAVPGAPARVH